mmetsp:Transcript_44662/g.83745  ORF Transcript_44662/g.83745 Transcript_44662/m.83745 type:complete len:254 (-) Transcript_44662:393-1154(-)
MTQGLRQHQDLWSNLSEHIDIFIGLLTNYVAEHLQPVGRSGRTHGANNCLDHCLQSAELSHSPHHILHGALRYVSSCQNLQSIQLSQSVGSLAVALGEGGEKPRHGDQQVPMAGAQGLHGSFTAASAKGSHEDIGTALAHKEHSSIWARVYQSAQSTAARPQHFRLRFRRSVQCPADHGQEQLDESVGFGPLFLPLPSSELVDDPSALRLDSMAAMGGHRFNPVQAQQLVKKPTALLQQVLVLRVLGHRRQQH